MCVCAYLHSSGLLCKTPSNEREWNESDVAGPVDPDSFVKSFSISLILRLAKLQARFVQSRGSKAPLLSIIV